MNQQATVCFSEADNGQNVQSISEADRLRMVSLNLLCLDKEIEEYSNDLYKASLELARVNSIRDTLKENLDITDAEVASAIRSSGSTSSSRITETQIKLDVLLTKDHQDAYNKFIDAQEEASRVYAFVKSLEAKKEMISCAAKLACAGLIDITDTTSMKKEINEKRVKSA